MEKEGCHLLCVGTTLVRTAGSWGLFPQPSLQEKEAPEPELRVHSSLLGGNETCVSSHGPATQCGNHVKTNV